MKEQLLRFAEITCDAVMNLRRYRGGPGPSCPPVVAHRGAWNLRDRLENTEPAFREAMKLGAWGVEFDVRFTRDNVPVLHHDPDLFRCHGVGGVIDELTLQELRTVAPHVMPLADALKLSPLHFMIEIKTSLTLEQRKILNTHLTALTPREHYHLLTLDPDLVFDSPKTPLNAWVLVGDMKLKPLVDFAIERKLAGVAGHYVFLTDALVARLHGSGLKAGVGFTPTANLYRREWARGIDWVFTNHLAQVAQAL